MKDPVADTSTKVEGLHGAMFCLHTKGEGAERRVDTVDVYKSRSKYTHRQTITWPKLAEDENSEKKKKEKKSDLEALHCQQWHGRGFLASNDDFFRFTKKIRILISGQTADSVGSPHFGLSANHSLSQTFISSFAK